MNTDCTGKNNGDFTQPSVMQAAGPSNPQQVTSDDALGMQAMAQDPDIPANALWNSLGKGPQNVQTPSVPQPPSSLGSSGTLTCGSGVLCSNGWGWHNQGQFGCEANTPNWIQAKLGCACTCGVAPN